MAAYCLDRAVSEFGNALSAELKAVEGKNNRELQKKSQMVLGRWLDGEIKYRDPASSPQVQAQRQAHK